MKRKLNSFFLLLFALFFSFSQHNLIAESQENSCAVLWKIKTGVRALSTALDSQENVYFGSDDGKVRCYKKVKGEGENEGGLILAWDYQVDGQVIGLSVDSKDLIYCSATDGEENHFVYCLDSNGEKRWKTQLENKAWGLAANSKDKIYCATENGEMVCLNHLGDILWNQNMQNDVVWGLTVDTNGDLFCSSYGGYIYHFGKNFELKGEQQISDKKIKGIALGTNGEIYCGCADKQLHILDREQNTKVSISAGDIVRAVTVDDKGLIYYSIDNGHIVCLNPSDKSIIGTMYFGKEIDENTGKNTGKKIYSIAAKNRKAYFSTKDTYYCIEFPSASSSWWPF